MDDHNLDGTKKKLGGIFLENCGTLGRKKVNHGLGKTSLNTTALNL